MGPQEMSGIGIVPMVIGVLALGMAGLLLVVRLTRRDRGGRTPLGMLPANSRVLAAVALLLGVGVAVSVTMAMRVR